MNLDQLKQVIDLLSHLGVEAKTALLAYWSYQLAGTLLEGILWIVLAWMVCRLVRFGIQHLKVDSRLSAEQAQMAGAIDSIIADREWTFGSSLYVHKPDRHAVVELVRQHWKAGVK